MLITLTEALAEAEREGRGLAAVNTPFFESLLATIDVGEGTDVPIVLSFAQSHSKYVDLDEIGPAMVALAERSPARFVVHIDHGEDIDFVRRGLDMGFTSCMLDGSLLPFEENIARTREVVEMAHARGASVEGELGVMSGNENGDPSQGIADASLYTRPEQAREFVERTGVDCLAASFGTVHGLYRRKPSLELDLISQLRAEAGVPIVMHGGSGLTVQEYRDSIARGVSKINYYTYSAKAALDGARAVLEDPDVLVFPDVAVAARAAVRHDVGEFLKALDPRIDLDNPAGGSASPGQNGA